MGSRQALVTHMLFENPDKYFTTNLTRRVAAEYRKFIIRNDGMARSKDFKKIYDALVAGDPKLRTLRSLTIDVASAYAEYAKQFRAKESGDGNA